jgi:hypothetical protein
MRQTVKIFLGRTVLRKTGKGNSCWVQKSREQSGKNRWTFGSFDASEKFLLESFLHVNELFYCISTRKAVALHKFRMTRREELI